MPSTNVITLQRGEDADPVFFTKRRLRQGTALRYFGRRDPGRLWFVECVMTLERAYSTLHQRRVLFPERLSDIVTLRCATTRELRILRFSSLSYSAIWRVED